MALLILAAFILVPLVEIAVFIQVGGALGLWPTLSLVVLTAILGTWQLRLQGLTVLHRAQAEMDRGVMPARELFDGLCLLVAGALLLTPGFVTDAVGGLLFVPALRDLLRRRIGRYVLTRGETHVFQEGPDIRRGGADTSRRGDVIDGDYRDVTKGGDNDDPPRRLDR